MGEQLKTHQPCPDCGSSDALTYYDWGSRCFSCGKATRNKKDDDVVQTLTKVSTRLSNVQAIFNTAGGYYIVPYQLSLTINSADITITPSSNIVAIGGTIDVNH